MSGIIQKHSLYTLLDDWEKRFVVGLIKLFEKHCTIIKSKVSDMSDITLFHFIFHCHHKVEIPPHIELVEVEKRVNLIRKKYFCSGGYTTVRIVVDRSRRGGSKDSLVDLEVYLSMQ